MLLAQDSLAMNAGRPVRALDATERLQELRPGERAHLRLRVLDALYGDGDRTTALDAMRRLAVATEHSSTKGDALADACVVEQWRVATGSRRTTPRVIARLRATGTLPQAVLIGASPAACAELLEAQLAVAERKPDARARVARLDSLMLTGPAIGDAGAYAHIVVARLYLALGDRSAALAAVRRRSYMSGWPRYLATARLLEGRIAAQLGDARGRDVVARYLALRERPDSVLLPQVEEAKALARRSASH